MSRRPADSLAPQAHGDAHRVPKAPLAEPRQLGRPWAQPPIQEPSGRSALLEAIQPGPPLLFSRSLVVLKRQEVDRSEPNSVELLHPSGWHCLVAAAWIQAALATVAHPQASGAMLLDGPIGLKSLKDLLSQATAELDQARRSRTPDPSTSHPWPGNPPPARSAPDRTQMSSLPAISRSGEGEPAKHLQVPSTHPSSSLGISTAAAQGTQADSTRDPAPPSHAVAFNWALLWLSGTVSLVWLPLLLLDRLPEQRSLADGQSARDLGGAGLASQTAAGLQQLSGHSALQPGTTQGTLSSMLQRVQPGRPSLFSRPLAVHDREALPAALTDTQRTSIQRFDKQSPPLVSSLRGLAPVSFLAGWSESSLRPVTGAMLLGGPIGLEAINERAMVPAARVERARLASASDQLQAIPLPWRQHLRALLGSSNVRHPLPAEIVRIPAAHLSQPQEIPLLVQHGGVADTTVPLANAASRRSVEHWLERQPVNKAGESKPVLIVLEPSGGGSQPPVSRQQTNPSPTPGRHASAAGWSSVKMNQNNASAEQSSSSLHPDSAASHNQAAEVSVQQEASLPSQTP